MRVDTKQEMYTGLQEGRFGNCFLIWPSVEAYLASGYAGAIGLRYRGERPGGPCIPVVKREEVPAVVECLAADGWECARISPTMIAPADSILLAGEVGRLTDGLYLRYSTVQAPMREAFAQDTRHARGIVALSILRHFLNENSYEDLMLLLEEYPDSIIEFTAYAQDVGRVPNRNAVVWEVRNY